MSVTIDIRGLRPEDVVVAPAPLAELGAALHSLAESAHHPESRGWTARVSAELDTDLVDRLCEAEFLWRTTHSDVFLPFAGLQGAARPAATLGEELDLLDRLSDAEFVDAALEFTCSSSYSRPTPYALDDASVQARALEMAAARGPRQLRFAELLLNDPPTVRVWLRRLLEDCEASFFGDMWERVLPELAADARHKTELLRRKGLSETLRAASPALRLDEDARTITVDKLVSGHTGCTEDRGLALVPTVLNRPHMLVLHRAGWQPVLHYPVVHPATTLSSEQLAGRMKALAHPARMQLCRHLARSAYATSELAEALESPPPEVSRHLAVLRKAGLITTQRFGRYSRHQLDLNAVARLGSEFIEGLLR